MSDTVARVTVGEQVYQLDPNDIENTEAIEIEEQAGYMYLDWIEALNNRSMKAISVLVWIVKSRDDPAVNFGDVKFRLSELKFEIVTGEPAEGEAPKEEPGPGLEETPTTSES